ncbi:MAG: hypothetical protein CFE44_05185 [Burkholderiales bacterium PBB4]|nr:MAG: hypothetical protein CFE44_05185 [Burkholderiales bacterium PBB4]
MNDIAPPAATEPLLLTAIEARVLGTLMEKARTVPDSYPLTLNSLISGCNQKSSRDPFMELSEADVAQALNTLQERSLVHQSIGGRTGRYTHNAQRGIGVPEQSAVLLGLLMLRGPQTAAELRLNAERWYRFADISSVEGFLEELQDRAQHKGGPLTIKLPKAPGAREQRWAHLLCGPVDLQSSSHTSAGGATTAERLAALEAEVARLRDTVQFLCKELGLSPSSQQ